MHFHFAVACSDNIATLHLDVRCDVCVCVYAGGVRKGQNAISAAMYLPIRFSTQSDCHTISMHFHFFGPYLRTKTRFKE